MITNNSQTYIYTLTPVHVHILKCIQMIMFLYSLCIDLGRLIIYTYGMVTKTMPICLLRNIHTHCPIGNLHKRRDGSGDPEVMSPRVIFFSTF